MHYGRLEPSTLSPKPELGPRRGPVPFSWCSGSLISPFKPKGHFFFLRLLLGLVNLLSEQALRLAMGLGFRVSGLGFRV